MGFLKGLVREIIELPGEMVKTVTKEAIALPGRVVDGMEEAGEILFGDEDEKKKRRAL